MDPKKAAKSGTIIGMIWHQGESDATSALYPTYQNKLIKLFNSIRSDLKLPSMFADCQCGEMS